MTVTIGDRGRVVFGDAVERLRELPDGSVDCVVTSPPYWQLRDYGHEGQLGLEATPRAFVERLADVFDEVWRVLSPRGTCWVNLGDTYLSVAVAVEYGRRGLGIELCESLAPEIERRFSGLQLAIPLASGGTR